MRIKAHAAMALVASLALALSACGSDSDGGSDSTGGTGGTGGTKTADPIKVGIFTSTTGPSSATFQFGPDGAKARIEDYKASGGKCASRGFDIVDGDDASSPDGALKVSQKFVQQDKVDAIIEMSPYFFGSSQFLATQAKDVPVFAGGFDAAKEYSDPTTNIFSVLPPPDYSKTYEGPGNYFKAKGVTKIAMISFDSEAASASLDQARRSVEANGIDVAYYNNKIPFSTTDVNTIVRAIIDSKADGLDTVMTPETAFAIAAGLRQAGYADKLKITLLATGYGADLLKSEPAVQAAQGMTFTLSGWTPNELGGAPVEKMAAALKKYGKNESGIPSFSQAMGYLEADLFLFALEKAGCDATGPDMIKALHTVTDWDAGGLGSSPRDFTTAVVKESCAYYLTLEDHAFVPDPAASPICGGELK